MYKWLYCSPYSSGSRDLVISDLEISDLVISDLVSSDLVISDYWPRPLQSDYLPADILRAQSRQ